MRPLDFKSSSMTSVLLMRMNGTQASDKERRPKSVREAKRRERVVKRVGRKTEGHSEKGLGTAVAGFERSSKVLLCVATRVVLG